MNWNSDTLRTLARVSRCPMNFGRVRRACHKGHREKYWKSWISGIFGGEGFFCVWSALFLDLVSQTLRPRGRGRPLFPEGNTHTHTHKDVFIPAEPLKSLEREGCFQSVFKVFSGTFRVFSGVFFPVPFPGMPFGPYQPHDGLFFSLWSVPNILRCWNPYICYGRSFWPTVPFSSPFPLAKQAFLSTLRSVFLSPYRILQPVPTLAFLSLIVQLYRGKPLISGLGVMAIAYPEITPPADPFSKKKTPRLHLHLSNISELIETHRTYTCDLSCLELDM